MEEEIEKIFTLVQKFLKKPPVVIWGSGATIPFGLPSMRNLNEALKENIEGFDPENDNLEIELSKEQYTERIPVIKKIIWDVINSADNEALKNIIDNNGNEFYGIRLLFRKFLQAHPEVLNIITTNYDRVLEHLLAHDNIPFSDGFNGRPLSVFDEEGFREKRHVNIIKVHGSLNWFEINGEIRYLPVCTDIEAIPLIILPSKNKYQEAYDRPYRELIQKSDSLIKDAEAFFVIGFGFNDMHLTPKIRLKVSSGTPLILITKKITESTFEELQQAKKYILLEEAESNKTKIHYKANDSEEVDIVEIDGNYWQLKEFMEIL